MPRMRNKQGFIDSLNAFYGNVPRSALKEYRPQNAKHAAAFEREAKEMAKHFKTDGWPLNAQLYLSMLFQDIINTDPLIALLSYMPSNIELVFDDVKREFLLQKKAKAPRRAKQSRKRKA